MSLLSSVKTAVVRRVVARNGGVDLTKLDRVPERLSWPLNRNGVDPTRRLSRTRNADPVHRHASFLGLDIWLVTGYDEARTVLADSSLTGAIYLKGQEVAYQGNFSGQQGCTQVVARTIEWSGNTSINAACSALGMSPIPAMLTVKLIE